MANEVRSAQDNAASIEKMRRTLESQVLEGLINNKTGVIKDPFIINYIRSVQTNNNY